MVKDGFLKPGLDITLVQVNEREVAYAGCPDPEGKMPLTCFRVWSVVLGNRLSSLTLWPQVFLAYWDILRGVTKSCSQLYGMNVVVSLSSHCMTSYFTTLTMWRVPFGPI